MRAADLAAAAACATGKTRTAGHRQHGPGRRERAGSMTALRRLGRWVGLTVASSCEIALKQQPLCGARASLYTAPFMSYTSIPFTARTAFQGMCMMPPAFARAMGARMITTISPAAT